MKVGVVLHPDRGMDAVLEEARLADLQGFDSVWLSDHLADPFGVDTAEGPYESFTLMTAIGAITKRTRLGWAMLNLSFRRPVVLAKMIATLDHISHGRVICAVGSGWFKKEYEAYDIPLIDDHDDRVAFGREVVRLLKYLWSNPAPERVDFDGQFVHVKDLAFNPAPYQTPHPPIWIGGDSAATLASIKELADGWVMITSGTQQRLAEVTAEADWPTRPMELVKNARIHVGATREAALDEVERVVATGDRAVTSSVEEFVVREVVGTPDECLVRLRELESWGITSVRVNCMDAAHQARIAEMILPALGG